VGVFLWPERPGELCLAGGFKVNGYLFCLAGGFKVKVKDLFVLPEGSPSRAGSRPGPAPALSGKHNRPLRGYPQQKRFPDGPGAIRSRLNAPSRRIPAARPGKHFSLGVCDASSRSKPRSKSKR